MVVSVARIEASYTQAHNAGNGAGGAKRMRFDSGCTSISRWIGMYRPKLSAALLLGSLALLVSSLHAQTLPSTPATIQLLIDGKPTVTLDRQTLAHMPRTSIDTPAIHHEPPAHWQGVALQELLQNAGVPSGEQLRGHSMTTIVRVSASDHYQVVFSLGELDPLLGNEQVLLVDTQDGHPLTKDGPFRLVVPGDKRPARWIHNVTRIEVTPAAAATP
jgi:hypothetical protein